MAEYYGKLKGRGKTLTATGTKSTGLFAMLESHSTTVKIWMDGSEVEIKITGKIEFNKTFQEE
jgi:hypothetical protein